MLKLEKIIFWVYWQNDKKKHVGRCNKNKNIENFLKFSS